MQITQDQQVEFDEFSRACDLVEGYFGATIDDIALHAPVSRRQLVAVLARAQLSGRQLAIEGLTEEGEVVYQSNDETLLWLDGGFWNDMRGRHHLEPDEGRAAREVHRRLIEAIDGDVPYYNRERDPFVLIERFDPYE
ncbi:hypothetical protein C477_15380 [Haloterrigena salina JCM 13891]|uniref:DUF8048 domain-containing protein n=1 Tax=Haloterrigena salina JCM 13891 TaxID=1227488 RepID=M0BZI3_9EURY|nr:hypothetical protein [Haloterrigena salina]ELZ16426.1 hypothetical protein C477_15380 [Haloterrigena salina JCM 13891]